MVLPNALLVLALMLDATGAAELTPFVNMGIGGVMLWVYLAEKKERLADKEERSKVQEKDDARYEALLERLVIALKDRIILCPFDPQKKELPLIKGTNV